MLLKPIFDKDVSSCDLFFKKKKIVRKGGDFLKKRPSETNFLQTILTTGLESGDTKPFWKYVRSQKQEHFVGMCMTSHFTVRTIVTFSGPVFKQKYKVNFLKLFVRSIVVFRTKFHQ